MAEYTLALIDARAELETVGGKGESLAKLSRAGLPVPGGFHVTTDSYRRFVAENGLQPRILAAVREADAARPETLEKASRRIGEQFEAANIPVEVAAAITAAYSELKGAAVAVRSSATAEDLPDASFAGQQETYLNISGGEALLAAVRRCWASLWTARAIGYRIKNAIDQERIALAVVVQELVPADAAGVMFTADPSGGAQETILINAAWGFGEAVVSGAVTPDLIAVDKTAGGSIRRKTGLKQVMTIRTEDGTAERPVPDSKKDAPVLNDGQVRELAELGRRIEALYGRPMDIEWALAEGKFAILQARPITTLPQRDAASSTEWPLPGKGTYSRGSVIDLMADPLTPLFATLGRDRYNAGSERLMEWFIGDRRARIVWLEVINGYAYMSPSLSPGAVLRIVLSIPRMIQIVRVSEARWRNEAVPRYKETVARWQTRSLPEVPAGELLKGAREVFDVAMDHLFILQAGLLGGSQIAEGLNKDVYDRFIRKPGDPDSVVLIRGYDSAPILAEKSLYDLARWLAGRADLADYARRCPAQQIAADLAGMEAPAGVDAAAWREFQTRWRAHLERYGAMIYTIDFGRPLPADEPAPLLETLKLYAGGEIESPHLRQQRMSEQREAAVQFILKRQGGLNRRLFAKILHWAQHMAPLREDTIAFIGYGYPQLRRMFAEIGRRLVQSGAIDQPEDIFWLTEPEVEEAAAALDRNELIATRQAAVRERRAEWQARKRLSPPPILPLTKGKGFSVGKMNMGGLYSKNGDMGAADLLKGFAASPGRVTAVACILHGPEDFSRMQPGCVLVAEITTPAWTPLFAMAAAVVTDVGGPLSHGSIVAREYGIPAVMGTGEATRRIRSGQTVTVDGGAGTVAL